MNLGFLGNCLRTPPLTQKLVLMLTQGRGRWAVSLKPKLIHNLRRLLSLLLGTGAGGGGGGGGDSQKLIGASPLMIPETIAGHISVPIPFSSKWPLVKDYR